MDFPFTQEALFKFLKTNKLDPILQDETNLIYIHIKVDAWDIPVFFDVKNGSGLLQIIGYLPFSLHKQHLTEVARLLHTINRQFEMPGFGMDEEHQLMFYRIAIPTLDNTLDERLVLAYIKLITLACATFIHAIQRVASGEAKADDAILKKKRVQFNEFKKG